MVPYGYTIENGRVKVDPEAAARIREFVRSYLDGLSITKANQIAEIPLSINSLYSLLQNNIYMGTDYYPQILSEEVFHSVQEARKTRTHPKTVSEAQPMPAKDRFRLKMPTQKPRRAAAASNAAYLYSLIVPAPDGDTRASAAEKLAIRLWLNPRDETHYVRTVKGEDLNWR